MLSRWIFSALAIIAIVPVVAFADAGAVRVSERHGNRQITVFTDPTPLRVGPADVSILVQDAATGGAVLTDAIEIEVAPRGDSVAGAGYRATSAAASNKLFQAANFDLPHAGWWRFTVDVRGPQDVARVEFEAEVGEPLPAWQAMWPWYCWPLLPIALFAAGRFPGTHARLARYFDADMYSTTAPTGSQDAVCSKTFN